MYGKLVVQLALCGISSGQLLEDRRSVDPTVDPRITGNCWSCAVRNNITDFGPQDDAMTMYSRCVAEGESTECYDQQTTCSIIERMDSAGYVLSIETGCKARDACEGNMKANFRVEGGGECLREDGRGSKCVDCCLVADGTDCVLNKWMTYMGAAESTGIDETVAEAWNQTLPAIEIPVEDEN